MKHYNLKTVQSDRYSEVNQQSFYVLLRTYSAALLPGFPKGKAKQKLTKSSFKEQIVQRPVILHIPQK